MEPTAFPVRQGHESLTNLGGLPLIGCVFHAIRPLNLQSIGIRPLISR
jgi:hypothetical protein